MRSRLEAGRELARLQAGPTNDELGRSDWHKRWLALDDCRIRLLDAWCDGQRVLENHPGWFGLSDQARAEAERASGLTDIDTSLRKIHRRLRRLMRKLPTEPSLDISGVVANLRVAERLLPFEENPVVHGLIKRAARDLGQMQDR